eukprot:m.109978 g.109978  ORF g.109978 m.109978 type:complete len:82 (+) comp12741_c1_seq16:512-757(+)
MPQQPYRVFIGRNISSIHKHTRIIEFTHIHTPLPPDCPQATAPDASHFLVAVHEEESQLGSGRDIPREGLGADTHLPHRVS